MTEHKDEKLKSFLKDNDSSVPPGTSNEWENIQRRIQVKSEKTRRNFFIFPAGIAACLLAVFIWQIGFNKTPQISDDELIAYIFEATEEVQQNEGEYYLSLLE